MSNRILVRGGCVLTLGARSFNHPQADVLIEDGRITDIAARVRARDAEVIDASEAIVMPGMVDTHRHSWMSLFRNSGDLPDPHRVGPHHQPDDLYAATLVGLLAAAEAGVTTVVDWADVGAGPDRAAAIAQAHADSGLRTVLVVAAAGWETSSDPLVADAPAVGERTVRAFGSVDPDRRSLDSVVASWERARAAGLRVHAHLGRHRDHIGLAAELAGRGALGEDVTLVHCSLLDDTDLDAIAAAGAAVSITPSSEMAGGLGSPPMQRLLDRGIRPGLGIDHEQIGPGDVLAQMRAAISIQHGHHFDLKLAGKGGLPNLLTTREVIRYATSDGARAAGLSDTGSLETGKRADLVVLRTDRPNIHPVNDPIGAVVWGMDSSNVEWVVVDGRIVVREGELDRDVAAVRTQANRAVRRVAEAAGLVAAGVEGGR